MGGFIAAEHGADLLGGGTFCTRNISELQTESNAAFPHSGYLKRIT